MNGATWITQPNMTKTKKLFILLVTLVGVSYFFGAKLIDYFENKPKIATELIGIRIGEKLSDVLFKNEGFTVSRESDNDKSVFYQNETGTKQFVSENGVITRIASTCDKEDTTTEYAQIKCNANGEEILKKYQQEIKIICRHKDDDLKTKNRLYDLEKYGIRFALEYNKVIGFLIAEPNKLFTEKNKDSWSECK